MAEITAVAADVKPASTGASLQMYTAGETITEGMWVYADATDSGKVKKADNSTAAKAAVVGVAQTSALVDEPIAIQKTGKVDLGAAVAAGTPYYISSTAGNMELFTDVASTQFVSQVATADDSDVLTISFVLQGVAKA